MLDKKIQAVFKRYNSVGLQNDCFGFYRNLSIDDCKRCDEKKRCGEIKNELVKLHLPIPKQDFERTLR